MKARPFGTCYICGRTIWAAREGVRDSNGKRHRTCGLPGPRFGSKVHPT